ncbi:MAG: SIS domain-containing protein [Candidatus Methylacidiphilales bacterium]|nr:SIS domain-containing protein [Candidatus Methylacidiphilales bacterium]
MNAQIHLAHLIERCPALAPLRQDVAAAHDLLLHSVRQGGHLLLAGNGGSAADCEHWSGELLKGFKSKRPLGADQQAALGSDIGPKLQGGIPAIPLTGFPGLATAFGNDVDPVLTYAQLVWALGRPGDVFIAISTSGNAANVGFAARTARTKGLKVLGLTGETGGKLAPLCDLCLRVPSTETFRIQEYHLPIYHCLCLMLEDALFPA